MVDSEKISVEKLLRNAKLDLIHRVNRFVYDIYFVNESGINIKAMLVDSVTHFELQFIELIYSSKEGKYYIPTERDIIIDRKSLPAAVNKIMKMYNMSGTPRLPEKRRKRDLISYLVSILEKKVPAEDWEYDYGRRGSPGRFNVRFPGEKDSSVYSVAQMAKKLGVDLKTFEG